MPRVIIFAPPEALGPNPRAGRARATSNAGNRRRQAVILAADVVGYLQMVAGEEPGTLARLAARGSDGYPQVAACSRRPVLTQLGDILAAYSSGSPRNLRAI
jgi:hypothetical protein